MAANTHLSMQLQEAGIDSELINQVLKLKEIENLVNDGKVSKEVYDKLVDDVLKPKIDENQSIRTGNSKVKGKNSVKQQNNMMNRLRGVIYGSKRKKSRTPRSENSEVIPLKEITPVTIVRHPVESKPMKIEPPKPKVTPAERQTVDFSRNRKRKKLLQDNLLRLGQDKEGNAHWRKVRVVLYDDSLEYYIKTQRGHVRNKKVISLSDDFFVNAEINKTQLRRIYSKGASPEEEDEGEAVFGQPHLFLLSDLDEHYYFAAEDEMKKEFWVSMLVQTIRDISEQAKDMELGKLDRQSVTRSKRFVNKYDTLRKSYYQQKIRKTMRIGKLEDFKEENFMKEDAKWKRQGEKLARESIAVDFKRAEMERARVAMQEQEALRQQLADKEKALAQITKKYEENDQQWREKYDTLLVEQREEAKKRNDEREKERENLQIEIEKMQRDQAVTFRGSARGSLSIAQQQMMEEYENQLKQYKAKLSALESALNVDMSSLDWDGTLQDAEEKMQALVPELMSENEEVRREAQQKFDQWDNIVRNHADFRNREVKKWESWEEENFEKNLNALNEMREKFVPKKYLTGISQSELIKATGIQKKTARRIMQNKIFKFFYMDKDRIAKIHIADLMNNYASQGLDIRETRAVYACLPDEFQNDNDGRKKEFRDTLRNRLAELTKKEENNSLTANEKMHNAYRTKEVKVVRKIAGGKPAGKRVKKNKAFASKALALQAMLQGGGGGPPAFARPPPAAAGAAGAGSSEIDLNAKEWKTYLNMKKGGLSVGAIKNRMLKDGKDPSKWEELEALATKASAASGTPKVASSPKPELKISSNSPPTISSTPKISSTPRSDDPEWTTYFKMQKAGIPDSVIMNRIQKDGKNPNKWLLLSANNNESVATLPSSRNERSGSATSFIDNPRLGPSMTPRDPLLSSAAMREKLESGDNEVDISVISPSIDAKKSQKDEASVKKTKSKKRKKSKNGRQHSVRKIDHRSGSKVHAVGDAETLLSKAQLDYAVEDGKKTNRKANLNLQYGRASKAKSGRNMNAIVDEGLQELVKVILEEGEHDAAEGGQKTIKFGELSDRYESISDMLVGLLLKAKRQKLIKYRGDMLFKGIHDQIKITVR